MVRRRVFVVATAVVAVLGAACSGGSAEVVASAVEAEPTAAAEPTSPPPVEEPTVEPTATPVPPTPEPTAEPTATAVPPTPTPEPTPEPGIFQDSLERIRTLANLTDKGLAYDDYVELEDETGLVSVTVPSSWSDIERSAWSWDDEIVGVALTASPSIEGYLERWDTPGVFIGASDRLPFDSVEEMIDDFWFGESCTVAGREAYDDGAYVGLVDIYTECGDEGAVLLQIIAGPADGSYLIEAQMIAPTDRDLDAVFIAIDSFIAAPA